MISLFRINPRVIPHLNNCRDLMERVVSLTNEYTVAYFKSAKGPSKVDLGKYDRELIPLIHKLLDKRIKKPLRKYITVQIKREDDDLDQSMLEIVWDEKKVNFIVPPGPGKDGKITFH